MKMPERPGMTQGMVRGRGFEEIHGQWMLVDELGFGRILYELTADPDQVRYAPEEAFERLLRSLPQGIVIRFLKVDWPNAVPRRAFVNQIAGWRSWIHKSRPALQKGLEAFLISSPLPFFGRNVLEGVVTSEESLAWLEAAAGQLGDFGIDARRLEPAEVQGLAQHLLNPRF